MNAHTTELARRRRAAERLPVLDCGCADPWVCNCGHVRTASSYAAAVSHLLHNGLLPAPDVDAMRVLWRHKQYRHLVSEIASRWEVAS